MQAFIQRSKLASNGYLRRFLVHKTTLYFRLCWTQEPSFQATKLSTNKDYFVTNHFQNSTDVDIYLCTRRQLKIVSGPENCQIAACLINYQCKTVYSTKPKMETKTYLKNGTVPFNGSDTNAMLLFFKLYHYLEALLDPLRV